MRPTRPTAALAALLLVGCSPATLPPASTSRPATAAGSAASPSGAASHGAGAHFEYEGDHGPGRWASLDPAWALCSSGRQQSPVDLRPAAGADLPDLSLDYRSSAWTVRDNGHALVVEPGSGSTARWEGQAWPLLQFHLHTPSEHTVDGQAAAGEVHFVHRDDAGRLLVVGALLVEGAEDAAWSWLSKRLPTSPDAGHLQLEAASPRSLLPAGLAYRTYQGSLTTPPCTEGVRWVVLDEPVVLSAAQLAAITTVAGHNARPVQDIAGRVVQHDDTPGR